MTAPPSSLPDSLEAGLARGPQLFPEVAQALGHLAPDAKLPDWVRNAWKHVAGDFLGLTALNPEAEPPRRLGKQLAMMQHFLNQYRKEPFELEPADRERLECALGFLDGWILAIIHRQLGRDDRRSAQFFEAFSKFKTAAVDSSKRQVGRATTLTYFFLIIHWQGVAKCRSQRQAFELLKATGMVTKSDWDGFRSICRRIKLRLRGRGRPNANQ